MGYGAEPHEKKMSKRSEHRNTSERYGIEIVWLSDMRVRVASVPSVPSVLSVPELQLRVEPLFSRLYRKCTVTDSARTVTDSAEAVTDSARTVTNSAKTQRLFRPKEKYLWITRATHWILTRYLVICDKFGEPEIAVTFCLARCHNSQYPPAWEL